jgi:hypothetical protein
LLTTQEKDKRMARIDLPNEKQVGHLTLHRQGRQISLKQYNALAAAERLEMIRQAQGKKKYDLLINANDAERLTPQLHPQELYLTVNQIGSEYAVELLMLASPEQITTLLDLDCWEGDSVSPVLSLGWIQLILETGVEKICQLAEQIDPEILALFLKKHLTITRGLEVYDDDDAENAKRLESLYDIEFASEDAAKTIGAFLKILMEHSQENYLLIMEMIRSEVAASLEEEVFQGRNNRLADLGFVPASEAKSIYSYIDPDSFSPGGKSDFRLEADESLNPAALLVQANPHNLLAEVLTNGLSHELATELCMLANRKMSADGTDISSASEVAITLQELYDTLNLALEYQVGSDASKAEQIVGSTYLLQLYQLGHSLLLQLQHQASQILGGPIGAFLDYPEQLFLDALLEKPPVYYLESSDEMPSQLQAISSRQDLELVSLRLQQIVDLQQLFTEKLPFTLPTTEEEDANEVTLSMLLLTAVANQLLGRPFSPAPLAPEDLMLLKAQTLSDGELKTEFATQFQNLIEKLDISCDSFINFCLDCWQEDLHIVDLDNLDADDQLCLLLEV